MLHYVHKLVSNFVGLLCGAEQVVYSGFIRAFSVKTEACWKQVDESGDSEPKQVSCWPQKHNNEPKDA